ncbi:hypothetical protein HJG60_010424 [Phyllostomus discolor]|uniref:Uncharacterized protein n=1 Tax=Phyllostomus discolor TaxID=89673 RepID=A0A833YBD3_9CHIR|nr:hypothetical protein HJG60_010424 [Phyllostomus discolor]
MGRSELSGHELRTSIRAQSHEFTMMQTLTILLMVWSRPHSYFCWVRDRAWSKPSSEVSGKKLFSFYTRNQACLSDIRKLSSSANVHAIENILESNNLQNTYNSNFINWKFLLRPSIAFMSSGVSSKSKI